jgi:hypothetical protein
MKGTWANSMDYVDKQTGNPNKKKNNMYVYGIFSLFIFFYYLLD